MADRGASWTGKWVAEQLTDHTEVRSVEIVAPQVIRVVRRDRPVTVVGTIASARVVESTVKELWDMSEEIEFVANIPREAVWTGAGIEAAVNARAGWGGFGDLRSALGGDHIREYQNRELAFVERGLRQHSRVLHLEREYDRKYKLIRRDLPPVTIVQLNEYDIVADSVRTARDRYGQFNAILHANPNGGVTGDAIDAAASMGVEIYTWGELLRQLNKR